MNVTIDDAISALRLLRDHIKDNDYLWECYNLGISALKTIKDGNYQLQTHIVSRETLEAIANYNCAGKDCDGCIMHKHTKEDHHVCMSVKAKDVLWYEQNIKEVSEWIKQNAKNL